MASSLSKGHTPSIYGTGLVCLDVVVDGSDGRLLRVQAGGTCGNVLTVLASRGWRAFPVARLCTADPVGQCVRADLAQWGVYPDFTALEPCRRAPPIMHHIVHGSEGEASHAFTSRCLRCGTTLPRYVPITAAMAESVVARIAQPQVFFFDRVSRGALILGAACAHRGAIVVFEPAGIGDPKLFREALQLADIVKYSHDRRKRLGEGRLAPESAIEIETLGKQGVRYISELENARTEGWKALGALPAIEVKDAAGAGDWCTAGMLSMLGLGGRDGLRQVSREHLEDALLFGQSLAAWNCGFEGARGGMYGPSASDGVPVGGTACTRACAELDQGHGAPPGLDVLAAVCPRCGCRPR